MALAGGICAPPGTCSSFEEVFHSGNKYTDLRADFILLLKILVKNSNKINFALRFGKKMVV